MVPEVISVSTHDNACQHTHTHTPCMAASTYDITVASQKDSSRVRASQADVTPFTQCQLRNDGVQRLQDGHAACVFFFCDRMQGKEHIIAISCVRGDIKWGMLMTSLAGGGLAWAWRRWHGESVGAGEEVMQRKSHSTEEKGPFCLSSMCTVHTVWVCVS